MISSLCPVFSLCLLCFSTGDPQCAGSQWKQCILTNLSDKALGDPVTPH